MDEKEVAEMQEEMMTVLEVEPMKAPMSKASPMSWKICSRQ